VPAVLPEAGLVLAIVAVPFAAFCVVIGMYWSLRSRGTLGSVTAAVAIIGAVAGTVGLCAWNAGSDLPVLGPVLGALSPLSAAFSCIVAEHGMEKTVSQNGLAAARTALFIGAIVAALAQFVVIYGVHATMTKSFDFTVRKLAGMK
jgi:hypothetical protein